MYGARRCRCCVAERRRTSSASSSQPLPTTSTVQPCSVHSTFVFFRSLKRSCCCAVIDNILEGNHGIGIYITDGYQARIEGNVIEGNEGPGIVASSMNALTITGNYFVRVSLLGRPAPRPDRPMRAGSQQRR